MRDYETIPLSPPEERPVRQEDETVPALPWHAQDEADVVQRLGADPEQGLSNDEAQQRLGQVGPNEITTQARAPWYHVFGRQFTEVLVVILMVAAAVSFLVGAAVDAITILVIVLLNGVLGFVQEWKAERAIEALRQMLTPHARVR
ncbi:MAG TPA: cation-transporting P-type ATPase, partial [Rhodothermales bacterium]|nr:cation-transporting P-type ATPase [Rhodothermales bacterium]